MLYLLPVTGDSWVKVRWWPVIFLLFLLTLPASSLIVFLFCPSFSSVLLVHYFSLVVPDSLPLTLWAEQTGGLHQVFRHFTGEVKSGESARQPPSWTAPATVARPWKGDLPGRWSLETKGHPFVNGKGHQPDSYPVDEQTKQAKY